MWYVIQTSTGREEKIKQECEQRISKDVLSHCVLPLYEAYYRKTIEKTKAGIKPSLI